MQPLVFFFSISLFFVIINHAASRRPLTYSDLAGPEDTPSETLVQDLTETTFESLTQASTGATTGDWFVMFYAPWCGYCKKLHPVWEDLAKELNKQVNVAKVNADLHRKLAKRFTIKAYPTLIFFRQGKMYRYDSGNRDLDALQQFALGTYASSESEPVPPPPGMVDLIKEHLSYAKSDFWLIMYQAKAVGFALLGVSFALGWLARDLLYTTTGASPPSSGRHPRSARVKKDT